MSPFLVLAFVVVIIGFEASASAGAFVALVA